MGTVSGRFNDLKAVIDVKLRQIKAFFGHDSDAKEILIWLTVVIILVLILFFTMNLGDALLSLGGSGFDAGTTAAGGGCPF